MSTCWICGAPAAGTSLCSSCGDRARDVPTPARDQTEPELAVAPVIAATTATAAAPVAARGAHALLDPVRWAWRNRRGLFTAVLSGGVAVLLVLGISFGWADASDRASRLEHTVDDRERALERAERKLRKAHKEQRQIQRSLDQEAAANEFLATAYRGTQAELQQANSFIAGLQDQLRASSLQVLATQQCLNGVVESLNRPASPAGTPSVSPPALARC